MRHAKSLSNSQMSTSQPVPKTGISPIVAQTLSSDRTILVVKNPLTITKMTAVAMAQ